MMEQNLKEQVEKFKFCTKRIIDSIENENYDVLEEITAERQEILDSISKMNYSTEEINAIASELEIMSLQRTLSDLASKKEKELTDKISAIEKNKAKNNSYNRTVKGAVIFSKKI